MTSRSLGIALAVVAPALLVAGAAWSQNKPPAKPGQPAKVDEKEVDAAVVKAAEWLKRQANYSVANTHSELVLYTLIHAGVFLNDPAVDKGITFVNGMKFEELDSGKVHPKTYRIALAAMALEAANRSRWQDRIAEYAHFLVCNQCENGQWSYGEVPTMPVTSGGPGGGGGRQISSGGGTAGGGKAGEKTQVQKRIPINCPKRIGPPRGDHSNTQYGLLGLRACAEAGCVIPEKTWKDAKKVIEAAQHSDGGWAYAWDFPPPNTTLVDNSTSYGSMTCSGLCDLVICEWYLGNRAFKNEKKILKAVNWMGENFAVSEHAAYLKNPSPPTPGDGETWHYYYLYSLERAGMLYGTEKFGAHEWYNEGSTWLLSKQQADGHWSSSMKDDVADTCFAVLFLRRATKPIVPAIRSK